MSDRDDSTPPPGDDDAASLLAGYEPVDEPSHEPADVVVVADPHGHVERDEEAEERAAVFYGWSYLAVLFAVFLGLALLAYGCDDDDDDQAMAESSGTAVSEDLNHRIAFEFEGAGEG